MKGFITTKTVAMTILAALLMSVSAFSLNGKSSEMTIKTDAKDPASRNKVETITSFLKGVQDVKFDDKKRSDLIVKFNPDQTNPDMVIYVLKLLGVSAEQEGVVREVSAYNQGESENTAKGSE